MQCDCGFSFSSMAIPADQTKRAELARTATKRRYLSGATVFLAVATYWIVRLVIFLTVGRTEANYARVVMVPYLVPPLTVLCLVLGLVGQKVTQGTTRRIAFSVASGAGVALLSAFTVC